MFDGFWSGILGGLFGPAIAQWLRQFRYGIIFLVSVLGVQSFFFWGTVWYKGWTAAIETIFLKNFNPLIFIGIPIATGLFAIFVAFLGSLNASKKNEHRKDK